MGSDGAGHRRGYETSCYSYASGPIEIKLSERTEAPNPPPGPHPPRTKPPAEGGEFMQHQKLPAEYKSSSKVHTQVSLH